MLHLDRLVRIVDYNTVVRFCFDSLEDSELRREEKSASIIKNNRQKRRRMWMLSTIAAGKLLPSVTSAGTKLDAESWYHHISEPFSRGLNRLES